eukprot:gene36758-biopygen25616
MLKKLYLYGRYEVKPGPPEHRSPISAIYFATDHLELVTSPSFVTSQSTMEVREANHEGEYDHVEEDSEDNKRANLALKFMKHRDQFDREIHTRVQCRFDDRYVLGFIRFYDGDSKDARHVAFRKDAILKGYEEFPYCMVMGAGSRSLKRLVDHQHVAGQDWEAIRNLTKQITKAVEHVHEKGIIHGDLKALNILEVDNTLKLIDFDSSVNYKEKAFDGLKYSSACLPPEMFWKDENGLIKSTVDENLAFERDLKEVYEWTEETKRGKLEQVKNHLARNLLSLLLMKHPQL